jgi:multiple sugar transport system substrate-binding protein
MRKLFAAAGLLASTFLGAAGQAQAQGKTITLCWAAWDPANALVELSKDFTAKSGVNMKFEFVPWPNFADRMLNELNSKGRLCDLIIGDSQWIGGSAENKHYVKLNDFFAKEGIKMDDFMPATVTGYAEWPKGTPNYWALPAMGDALGWTYRKDCRRPNSRTSPSFSRTARSAARRCTARRSSPSAARRASPWA